MATTVPEGPPPLAAGHGGARWDVEALARLLGRTRAQLLIAVAAEGGHERRLRTAVLASRTGVSAPTASEHLGVLRGAGLITTSRGSQGAEHRLTPLGAHLVGRSCDGRPGF